MNRTFVNILIDLVAALLFLGMIATGYLLRFPLPPGSNKTLTLWSLSRHQWGNVHFWLSLGLLVVLLIHLALHWNWIVTVIGKRCLLIKNSQSSLIRSAIWTVGVFLMMCITFAWIAQKHVEGIPQANCSSISTNSQNDPQDHDLASAPLSQSQNEHPTWDDIYPIFTKNCLACHGPEKQLAGFRVDLYETFFGQQEKPPLVLPGQSNQSPLFLIISGARTNMMMADRHKLAESEVLLIKNWIDQGAK